MTSNPEYVAEYEARINRALDYIHEKMDGEILLDELAKAAFFSPFHFHRIFSAFIGETPNEYLRRIRLEKAANLLETMHGITVTDIAFRCGFSSSSVFARAFKDHFGISAKDYRNSSRYSIRRKFNEKIKPALKIIDSKSGLIEIGKFPAFHLAYIKSMRGYNQSIGKAWQKLFRWAYPAEMIGENTRVIGIPLDNPNITPAGKCRYYASITIPEDIRQEDIPVKTGVSIMDIPSGRYAVYHFSGYEKDINAAYQELYGGWLPSSGYEPADFPALELYGKNSNDSKKRIFRYDICLQIKPI